MGTSAIEVFALSNAVTLRIKTERMQEEIEKAKAFLLKTNRTSNKNL